MDTKAEELSFVASRVREAGCLVELIDVTAAEGALASDAATVGREAVAACHPDGAAAVLNVADRGQAVSAMSTALTEYVLSREAPFDGIVGIGGSGGTSLITPAMQALPVGFPKVMVTTMASGDVSGYVGCSDVTIMPSVVDVAGLNSISRSVLSNAASAVAGMARARPPPPPPGTKPTIAVSMFGVTTACCDAVRTALEGDYEVCARILSCSHPTSHATAVRAPRGRGRSSHSTRRDATAMCNGRV